MLTIDAVDRKRFLEEVYTWVSAQVRQHVGPVPEKASPEQLSAVCAEVQDLFEGAITDGEIDLEKLEYGKLYGRVLAEVLGYGLIEDLVSDDSVSEIMINGPRQVWVERQGQLVLTPLRFKNNAQVMDLVRRILAPLDKHVDEKAPMVDARLPDGSRVNIVIPPACTGGPSISIRKFARKPFGAEDLVRMGTATPKVMTFLEACVRAGLNIIIAGGTSTGKTTFLNVLSSFVPHSERIVTIEDAAELQLQQIHVVGLEARPPSVGGVGEITIRDLVINALRMRPDRIIVGECRSKEALDMLQAMNTGHDGCMTTIHSNSPRDTLSRIETMVLLSGIDIPVRAIREQVASAFDLIVYMERTAGGQRIVKSIFEIERVDGDTILIQEIFKLAPVERGGKTSVELQTVGLRPRLVEKLEITGQQLPLAFFAPDSP